MKKSNYIYTAILGICMMISLVLVGKMMLYKPASIHKPNISSNMSFEEVKKPPKNMIKFTNEDIKKIIDKYNKTPFNDVDIKVFSDNTIRLNAKVNRLELTEYLENKSIKIPFTAGIILKKMPEDNEIDIECATSVDNETGLVSLSLNKITINNDTIPEFLTLKIQGLFNELNVKLNDMLCQSEIYFTEVKFSDGFVEFN